MNWVRAGAFLLAVGVHAAVAAVLYLGAIQQEANALQPGSGKDDFNIVATVSLQSEESLGLDAISAERQDAAAAARAAPPAEPEPKQEEVKKEDTVEVEPPPPADNATLQTETKEKPVEKPAEKAETQPSNAAAPSVPQEEQRAASRDYEARRNRLFSAYNAEIYRTLMKHALAPRKVKEGRVIVELTLAPSGELLGHRIVASSGSDILDRTAIASVERAAPFPHAPEELGTQPYTVVIPFDYAVK